MLLTYIIFGVLALVVIGSALAMILSRNAVYSALFLVLNFVTVGLLYLILAAPFLALMQITVYAGSIMVLFLFVIMLLGAEKLPAAGKSMRGQRILAILLAVVLLGEAAVIVIWRAGLVGSVPAPTGDFASPTALGLALFTRYTLPFLVTSVILLSATVGAILFTRSDKSVKTDHIVVQESENPQTRQDGAGGL